ncbi:uncharacterized protein LOC113357723 [Papaver somniferum]|uniref:uncharacterized protein LOC113357723 n=1 Tax=Papaver somniferum TaxID=3469 RepID=UPI000E6F643F|nr:uncharacterized protein LOC113357723 [Papaver somniferum]
MDIEEEEKTISILREHNDIFAWSMEEMPGIDPSVACHKLDIKKTVKPFKQRIKKIATDYHPKIEAELQKIFGIPAQLVSDNGKQFEGENIAMLLNAFKIQSGKSNPLYPQCNGKVEATNKKIADNLEKKLEGHNKGWCEQAVLPTEVIIPTTKREAWEKNLSADLILTKLDDLEEVREVALQHMENYQKRLAREYNNRAKIREFQPGELVLREIPIYQKRKDGKLEKSWDGPYIIKRIVGKGAYELMDHEGRNTCRKLDRPWNRQFLKKYYP